MQTTKQRFSCEQCNLIWDVLIYPYYPDQKDTEIEFKKCPHCGAEDIKVKKLREG